MKRRIGNTALALLSTLPVFSQTPTKSPDLRHEVRFAANGRDTVFTLPHRFLIPGTTCVRMDSVLLSGPRLRVDLNAGLVYVTPPPDSGSVIEAAYESLPVRFKSEYRRWTPGDTLLSKTPEAKPSAIQTARLTQPETLGAEELQRSGSIFRSVSLGTNQGMRLESGLRLQVSGKVAPNVEVVASLTDQNTPIQPEGNTQTLQEIDKVFVQVNAPRFRATLGDFVFDRTGTRFGPYSRKLQGAMLESDAGPGSLTLLASASKGEFTTNFFQGQEGNQGPYQLAGPRGQRDIIVLAGTERVFIDGELLTRGEDNDYVIEYGTGQVTFTRRRLVTGDSRISVDFEFSDQKFQKNIAGVTGRAAFWDERLNVQTLFVRESDNKDDPIDFTMTDEYRAVLERAGDNPDSAVTSGIRYAGSGQGSYARTDSAGLTVYRYKGQGGGDYAVRFSYAGQGKGDYSFQGYDIYRYEGPGRGTYLPVITLPVPKVHQLADLSTSFRIADGVFAEGEMALSHQDLNTFSPRDDGNNSGTAAAGTFRMTERTIRLSGLSLGKAGIEGSAKRVDDAFRPLARIGETEYGRKWGTDEGVFWGERTGEVKGSYSPFEGFRLNGETGAFRRGTSFRSERTSAGLEWSRGGVNKVKALSEWIRTRSGPGQSGFWLRQSGVAETGWKGFRPKVSYEGEHRRDTSSDTVSNGFRFDAVGAALAFERTKLRIEIMENVRNDRQYIQNRLEPLSLARTQTAGLNVRGNALNGSMVFTHRNRDYSDPSVQDQKTDLAEWKLGWSLFRRAFDGTLHYQFSSTQISEMMKDTLRVGAGLGNYRYDPELRELIPDPDGDLLYRTIQTGTFLPVNDLKAGADIRASAARLFLKKKGMGAWLGRLSSRTLFRAERRDKERQFWSVNRSAFRPSWGHDPGLVTGLLSVLEDVEYSAAKGKLFIRLRLRKDDSESHQLVQEGMIRRVMERSLQAKGNPSGRLGFFLDYENKTESRTFSSDAGVDRSIRSNAASAELSYRPRPVVELALKAKLKSAVDAFPSPRSEALSVFLLPRCTYSIRERGQLRAELEWGRIRSSPSGRTLPFEMFAGDQPGRTVRANLLLTYKVAGHVMATASYRLRREPYQKRTIQNLQVEARAFF